MSRLAWYVGNRADAELYAHRATELLDDGDPSAELGMAYSNQSQLLMLAGRYVEAAELGEAALRIADKVDHVETRVHALNNVGTSRVRLGLADGVALLEDSLELALAHDLHDHAARAYVNLADGLNLHDGFEVEHHLAAGLAYCRAHQLDLQWVYLEAARVRSLLNRGHWAEAERAACALLEQPTNPSQRFEVLLPVLLLRIRRGEPCDELLAELDSLAQLLTEPQRVLPVVLARAEAAWIAGELPAMRAELVAHLAAAECREDVWRGAELHHWLRKADPDHVPPGQLAGPFGAQLAAGPRAGAAAWRAQHSPYEAAAALLDGTVADARHALAEFQRLGAEPAARLARARLRELGVAVVPRGPRRSTARHPLGLTNREDEVLRLLTEDLTNQQIAARLVVSERTVHHHVSSLLAKLQVRSRTGAAALARKLLEHDPDGCEVPCSA
jgi:DNA-binding CsgD family transcriptional regulator